MNMAFTLTIGPFKNRTKTVTRRRTARHIQPGQRITAIEKGMGLKRGEKVKRLGVIEVISITDESLSRLLDDPEYGKQEVIREGFPEKTPAEFVEMLCTHYHIPPETVFKRIEFKYIDENYQAE